LLLCSRCHGRSRRWRFIDRSKHERLFIHGILPWDLILLIGYILNGNQIPGAWDGTTTVLASSTSILAAIPQHEMRSIHHLLLLVFKLGFIHILPNQINGMPSTAATGGGTKVLQIP
jgi:hypothetical protein